MREYHGARKQYEKIVVTEGTVRKYFIEIVFVIICKKFQPAFKASLTPLKYTTCDGVRPASFELKENTLVKDQPLAFLRTDSNAVVQRCSVTALEKIEWTPTMQYWTLTEVNVIVSNLFSSLKNKLFILRQKMNTHYLIFHSLVTQKMIHNFALN